MDDILSQSAHRAAIEAQKRQEQVDAFSRAPTEEAEKARDRIEWLLGRRSYTRKRLEDKLLFKGFSSEAVDWALDCVEVCPGLCLISIKYLLTLAKNRAMP